MPGPEELKIIVRLKDFASKELKSISKGVHDFGVTATKAFAGISLGAFAAGAAGGAGLFALLKSAADRADNLNDLSRQLGVSVEALGSLQFAAKQSGVSVEELETALKTLNKGLGEINATGGGTAAEALNKLSAGLRQAARDGAPTEEIFQQIIRELEGLSAADRALVSSQLFGKGGSRLLRLVGEDVGGLMRRFRELGGVIDKDLAKSGDAFNDALNELSVATTGLANDIARALLPEATRLSKLLTERLLKDKPAILNFFADVVDGAATLGKSFGESAISMDASLGAITRVGTRLEILKKTFDSLSGKGVAKLVEGVFGSDSAKRLNKDSDQALQDASALSDELFEGAENRSAAIRKASSIAAKAAAEASAKLRELAQEQRRVGEEAEFMGPRLEDVSDAYRPYIDGTGKAAAANAELFKSVKDANRELEKQQNELESKDFTAGARKGFSDLAAESQKWGEVAQRAVRGVADSISDNLSDNLIDVINGTKNAKDAFRAFARSVLQDIQKIIIKELVLKAIQGVVGSFGGGGSAKVNAAPPTSAFAPLARGGVVSDGNILQFGSGVVLTGPTSLGLRGGRRAVAGEAGPEGILPLARDSQGRLGVRSQGGGGTIVNINVSVNQPQGGSIEQAKKFGDAVGDAVLTRLSTNAAFRGAVRAA